ncbi:hypothetical protein HWV23_12515 [Natronomonas halophila]|uniref:DUF7519 family protein n=1 Tax=Natronomonas halophila TaxID=2747817 RepID=UPI0015B4C845|nr:hypothetical protein [Natronomonas halophila]QLD86515.1 hypothetical protein HWV23_12515 [Natronomonas halophila]
MSDARAAASGGTTPDADAAGDSEDGRDSGSESPADAETTVDAAEPTEAPPRLSTGLAVGLGTVAAAFLAAGSPLSGAVALLGVAVLLASLARASTRLCGLAGGCFALALVAGGATGAPVAPLVGGAVLATSAWDVADHGIGLGRHVGREARTSRNELVHAAGSLAVTGTAGALAFGGYLVATGGQPTTALVFLLLGGVLLLTALRG